ncbi:uncharacterized protein LOC133360267 isoform X2 [Lethenteron reissneri]|uniref:uncharacterized protein LOC133360267 isoform X2 n=1 Tax=Lethenteron reissneri TaxID=7753 RepID=UPI002AB70ED5|nr:uncharacterized protein LOC133360267 isoform X2 [Lethenteron reissneri]
MYLSLVLCLLFPLLLLHAAPEPSTRDDTAHSQGGAMATEGGAMTIEGGAMATEGGAMTTEGGAMATEGGAMATEGGAMATEGGAMAMESGAAGTEGGAMATEGGGMATEHGGTAIERGAMATEGGGTATEGGAMATEGGAAGTEAGAVATEGDYEGDDVFVEAPDEDYAVLFPRDDGGDGGDDGDEAVERIFEAAVDDASDVFTLPNLLDDLVRAEMSELMPSDDDYDDDDGGAPDDIVDSMVDNSIVHRRRGSLYPDYQDLGASSSSTGEGRDPDYAAPMGVLINEARREMEDSRGLRDELGGSLVDVDGLPEAEVRLEAERGDLQRLVNSLSVVNGDAESQTR